MSLKDVGSIEKLGASNYATWSTDVKWALIIKGLWNAIDDPENLEDGDDVKALAFIGLTVEKYIKPTVDECDTARDAWDKLEESYKAKATAQRIKLKKDLATLQLGWTDVAPNGQGGKQTSKREDITAYVARASSIRNQLSAAGMDVPGEEFTMAILAGLPDEYTALVDTIVTSATPLEIEEVVPKLQMIEQRVKDRHRAEFDKVGSEAYSARVDEVTCWKCGAKGHMRRDCQHKPPHELEGKRVYVPPKPKPKYYSKAMSCQVVAL